MLAYCSGARLTSFTLHIHPCTPRIFAISAKNCAGLRPRIYTVERKDYTRRNDEMLHHHRSNYKPAQHRRSWRNSLKTRKHDPFRLAEQSEVVLCATASASIHISCWRARARSALYRFAVHIKRGTPRDRGYNDVRLYIKLHSKNTNALILWRGVFPLSKFYLAPMCVHLLFIWPFP